MTINGFYILKDEFFAFVNDPYLKDNKEGNRPFYYCIEQVIDNKKLYWMIPLSSRVAKYQKIVEQKIAVHKPVDGIYICKLPSDKESVFLIQDMFPVTEEFVEREYTLGGNPLILSKKTDVEEINTKAKKVLRLITRGIKLTPTSPDINKILDLLSNR